MIRGVLRNLVAWCDKFLLGDSSKAQRCVLEGFDSYCCRAACSPNDCIGSDDACCHDRQQHHVYERSCAGVRILGFLPHRSHLLPRIWCAIRPIDYIIKYK